MPSREPPEPSTYGFNSEVSYKAVTYHVQTESMVDEAEPSATGTINTLVYLKGTLVRKISSPCGDLGPGGTSLEERVKRQHLSVLGRIKRGEILEG